MTDTAANSIEIATASYGELITGLRETFASGRTRPAEWRRAQLKGILSLLTDHAEEICAAVTEDLGRPTFEAYSTEVGTPLAHVRHTLKHFEEWMKPTRKGVGLTSMPGRAEIIKDPLGVALIIAPWNYPVDLVLEPLAAALAAGNCVVIKPSELSPATSAVLARLLPQYVDDEAVVVVEGAVPETTALLANQFDHIFFTGSTDVGRVVMRAAAEFLTPVTLELGGKSPTIVCADADLDVAARRIAWAKCLNAGQTCVAPDYVLVERVVRDQFVDKLSAVIGDFYGSNPKASPDFGRIVNSRHHARLVGLLEGNEGTIALGGEHDVDDRYVAPTIVVDPDTSSPLMQNEIFGPILPVLAVDSIEEAVSFVNDRPKPLALYVYSKSKEIVERVLSRTSSGGVAVNHSIVHLVPEDLPFGGVGPSGMGAYHGKAGFDAFTHEKSVLHKPTKPDPALLYPPYKSWKHKLVRAVLK